MGKRLIRGVVLTALFCLPMSCAMLGVAPETDDTGYVDLAGITFTAESVKGHVQIKENRKSEWRKLQEGDTFSGYAFIRSGLQSNAVISVRDDNRQFKCEILDLLADTTISDIYEKLLSPNGITNYNKKFWGDHRKIDLHAPIQVCRDSLADKYIGDDMNLLAEACTGINERNADITEGGGGAMAGGGAVAASSSGGCGPGG